MTSVSIISRLLRQSGATEAPLKLPCHEAPAFRGRPGRPGQRMCVLVVRLEAYPCYIKRISRPALPYPSGDCGMAGPSPHDGAPAPLWKPYTSCAGFWMRCSNNQPVYGGSERRESSRHWQRQRRRVRSAEDAGGQAKRIVQQGGISSGWHHCSSSDPAPHAHLWQSRAGPGRELGRRQRHWQQHTAGGCGSTPTSTSSSPAAGTRGS